MLLRTKPNRLRFLLTASSTLAPVLAWSQVAELETVLLKPNSQVPVANTWYIDEAGNFVLMSEAQRQAVELAQLPNSQVPIQTVSDASSMQIPPEMLQQVMAYSAAMGGLAGGGLVGGLALTSGMLKGDDGVDGSDGVDGTDGQDGQSAYNIWLSAGNSGSEQDFLDSLRGATGQAGQDGNNLPYIHGGSSTAIEVNENFSGSFYKFTATDPDDDILIFSKSSLYSDEDLFSISVDGSVSFNSPPDYESPKSVSGGNEYKIQVQVTDDRGGYDEQILEVLVLPQNEAPEFLSSPTGLFMYEGDSGVIYTASALDPDAGDSVTFSLSADSADKDFFSISSNGDLSFDGFSDYEEPNDSNLDGVYEVSIVASDDGGQLATQQVSLQVYNINEAPIWSQQHENILIRGGVYPFNYSAIALDPEDDDITYHLSGNSYGFRFDSPGNITAIYKNVGFYTLFVNATDSDGLTSYTTIDLQVY